MSRLRTSSGSRLTVSPGTIAPFSVREKTSTRPVPPSSTLLDITCAMFRTIVRSAVTWLFRSICGKTLSCACASLAAHGCVVAVISAMPVGGAAFANSSAAICANWNSPGCTT